MRVTLALLTAVLCLILAAPARADDDRIVISGAVSVARGESVGDVVIADGPVRVRGTVRHDVVALHGRVFIRGRVRGDVIALSKNAVRLGPGAHIGGDLNYRGTKPAGADRVVAGEVTKLNVNKIGGGLGVAVSGAIWLAASVSTLVLGLLLVWLWPRAADAAAETARRGVGPAIGWGFGVLIGLPILAVLALLTLVGIPLGVGLLLALFPIYGLGYITAAWLLGHRLLGPPRGRALSFLAGWAILRVLAIIPVLGGLVWLAATIFGLGVLLVAAWRAREGPAAAQPEPA